MPDTPTLKLPPEYVAAMSALEAELAGDMDLEFSPSEGAMSEEGGFGEAFGYRRLAAATALLRLARLHDTRLHVLPYYKLALTMQVCPKPMPISLSHIGLPRSQQVSPSSCTSSTLVTRDTAPVRPWTTAEWILQDSTDP